MTGPSDEPRGVPVRRAAVLLGLSVLAVALGGSASAAARAPAAAGDQVVLSGDVVVGKGRVSGDVVVVHGSARVAGTASGSVVVLDGPVTVSGVVRGDVAALDGPVTLVRGAHVTGDVWVARGRLTVEVGAVIDGSVKRGAISFLSPGRLVTRIGFWVAISVSSLLLGLLLLVLGPRAADAVARAGRSAVGASIGWGIAALIGLPVAGLVLLVTLVGIPFGIGLLLALAMLYSVGYAYGAWILGRIVVRPPRHGGPRRVAAFLAGWAILRAIGFVPVAGGVVWFLTAGYGLGAATVAVWRARGRGAQPVPALPPTPAATGFGPPAPSPAAAPDGPLPPGAPPT